MLSVPPSGSLREPGISQGGQGRDEKGKMAAIEYTIYEQPQSKPELERPLLENPTQINKDIHNTDLSKKEKLNTDLSITDSISVPSSTPSPLEIETGRKRKETATQSAFEIYREIIMENISYDILITEKDIDRDRLDEIVELMLETVCTARKTLRIAGDDYPAELVRAKFMRLDSEHIRFVLDCIRKNTTKIHNIKQYLRAVLFNAPSTIENYYSARVAHDMTNGHIGVGG